MAPVLLLGVLLVVAVVDADAAAAGVLVFAQVTSSSSLSSSELDNNNDDDDEWSTRDEWLRSGHWEHAASSSSTDGGEGSRFHCVSHTHRAVLRR